MAKWAIFEQKLPGRMPNAHNNRSNSRPKKRPAKVSEKLVWDDFQRGKECQEIVAKFTLNEVVLD